MILAVPAMISLCFLLRTPWWWRVAIGIEWSGVHPGGGVLWVWVVMWVRASCALCEGGGGNGGGIVIEAWWDGWWRSNGGGLGKWGVGGVGLWEGGRGGRLVAVWVLVGGCLGSRGAVGAGAFVGIECPGPVDGVMRSWRG